MIVRAVRKIILFILNKTFITSLLIWYFKSILGPKNEPGEITVAGFLSSTAGFSKSAKITFHALKNKFKVSLYDFEKGYLEGKGKPGGTIIFYCNPHQLLPFLIRFPKKNLRGAKIIIQPFWETGTIPNYWIKPLEVVDEIWVCNEFVRSAFEKSNSANKIKIVPTPLEVFFKTHKTKTTGDKFKVLAILDFKSNFERKNPIGIIKAFKQAFGDSQNAILTLKVSSMDFFPEGKRKLEDAVNDSKNIIILQKRLSDEDLYEMMASQDTIISLHRSEGFGLVMAEAMLMGKPVIATGYSGNMEFMNNDVARLVDYKLIKIKDPQKIYASDSVWAEPDYKQAAKYLQLLQSDKGLRDSVGKKAQKHAKKVFSVKHFLECVKESLNYY